MLWETTDFRFDSIVATTTFITVRLKRFPKRISQKISQKNSQKRSQKFQTKQNVQNIFKMFSKNFTKTLKKLSDCDLYSRIAHVRAAIALGRWDRCPRQAYNSWDIVVFAFSL